MKDNIKTDNEIGDKVAERINLAQNRIPWQSLVKARINIRVADNVGNFSYNSETISFSSRTVVHGVTPKTYTYLLGYLFPQKLPTPIMCQILFRPAHPGNNRLKAHTT